MIVKSTAQLPNNVELGADVIGVDDIVVNFSAELPAAISEAMNIFDVVGVTGNVIANVSVVVAHDFFTEKTAGRIVMPLGVPKIYEDGSLVGPAINPDGSPFAVSGRGAPDVTMRFFDPAVVRFVLNDLLLDIDTLTPEYLSRSSRDLQRISFSETA